MEIFHILFVVKIVLFAWKDKHKRKKRPGIAHFYIKKKVDEQEKKIERKRNKKTLW